MHLLSSHPTDFVKIHTVCMLKSMKEKLTKAEQTIRTRRAILDRAQHLFATQGYAATGTEALIAELGITRGALYHQFGDKLGVFRAVVGEAFDEMTDHVAAQVQPYDDEWQQLVVGCLAFLEVAQREDLRRLIFIEAPVVLDAETWAEFDQRGFGLLNESIQTNFHKGHLVTIDAEGFAHLVNGALNELAAWVAKDPARLNTAQKLVENLLDRHQSKP
jgi:AcrR family transcriptional regulator